MLKERLLIPFAPERCFQQLAQERDCVFLDSGLQAYGMGRYSFLSCHPYKELSYRNGSGTIRSEHGVQQQEGDPFEFLRQCIAEEPVLEEGDFPFSGGLVGYLSYDLGRWIETLPTMAEPDPTAYELRFLCFGANVVFDHDTKETWVVARPEVEGSLELFSFLKATLNTARSPQVGDCSITDLTSNMSEMTYKDSVESIREYIRQGEVYQVNVAQRFSGDFSGDASILYKRLREASPAPYAAYLGFGDEQILSSSPEKFLTCRGRDIETRPIKGTRKRGATKEEDEQLWEELRHSEKDQSELLMIVDLERNDLGKVCQPGSIETIDLFGLEGYATVIHQTATVRGQLREDCDTVEALRSMFPGGSITGAPKIRAMEVIEELEPHQRGIYTGSIGYIGFDGQFDFNIAIRTIRCAAGRVHFSVGGGIVWDSVPDDEYEETLVKAKAMMNACGVTS